MASSQSTPSLMATMDSGRPSPMDITWPQTAPAGRFVGSFLGFAFSFAASVVGVLSFRFSVFFALEVGFVDVVEDAVVDVVEEVAIVVKTGPLAVSWPEEQPVSARVAAAREAAARQGRERRISTQSRGRSGGGRAVLPSQVSAAGSGQSR